MTTAPAITTNRVFMLAPPYTREERNLHTPENREKASLVLSPSPLLPGAGESVWRRFTPARRPAAGQSPLRQRRSPCPQTGGRLRSLPGSAPAHAGLLSKSPPARRRQRL